jgi:hypothetical protein
VTQYLNNVRNKDLLKFIPLPSIPVSSGVNSIMRALKSPLLMPFRAVHSVYTTDEMKADSEHYILCGEKTTVGFQRIKSERYNHYMWY